jgi:colanic acid/amylovoran biosynthesis glycosyltransferase
VNHPPKIGYVVKRYPRFSETFVVNEILAHESAGLPIEVFSLRPPVDTHFQDLISRVEAPVTFLSSGQVRSCELWQAMTACLRMIPEGMQRWEAMARESALDVYCGLQLARLATERRITHLHAHFASSAASVARIASLVSGIPYSITAHAKDIFHDSVCRDDLERKLGDATMTITVSDFNLRHLQQAFPEHADRMVRIYNGMHLADFPYRSPHQRPARIAAVGRFVEKKGFADLISACAILRDQNIAFECQLIGSGELESELANQIRELALQNRVRLIGPRPQREVKRLIQESAVLAAPCVLGADGNRDGLPTVLLESMALGTPCVSTDVTGIPEVITHMDSGLMVPQHAPDALAEALLRLLQDAELRDQVATRARKLIEQDFDVARNALAQRQCFADHVLGTSREPVDSRRWSSHVLVP